MTRVTFVNGPAQGKSVLLPENELTWDMLDDNNVWHRYTLDFATEPATARYSSTLSKKDLEATS